MIDLEPMRLVLMFIFGGMVGGGVVMGLEAATEAEPAPGDARITEAGLVLTFGAGHSVVLSGHLSDDEALVACENFVVHLRAKLKKPGPLL